MATAIFYASSTGNTEEVAIKIAKKLGNIETFDIAGSGMEEMNNFDKLIIGTSTWGDGELQEDFEESWDVFSALDFSGKTIALFGLGDQDGYADVYCNAMGTVYEKVIENGGLVVGNWSAEGYDHESSKAQIDDHFVGLALDEDNQDELTDERVVSWCNQIRDEIL